MKNKNLNRIENIKYFLRNILLTAAIVCIALGTKVIVNEIDDYQNTIVKLSEQLALQHKDVEVFKDLYVNSEQDIIKAKQETQIAQAEVGELQARINELEEVITLSSQYDIEQLNRGDIPHKDLTTTSIMTVDEMNEWIAERAPEGSPFLGKGELFLSIAGDVGIDVKYLFAHAALESTYGTSPISRDKNNFFGIGAFNHDPYNSAYTFKSFEDGLRTGAQWIKDNYLTKGQETLYKMIYGDENHVYCVDDEGNPSQRWIDTIVSIIK